MPYVVTQSCCADASCVIACPVNCIHPAPGEPGFAEAEMLYVDPKACVDCGACTTACPVDAILPHTKLTQAQLPFLELNARYFVGEPHADRRPLFPVPPQRRVQETRPVRVAIVGAGPAGLYAADELLKQPNVNVDVYDRLPTPYGLVRAGVAPDHQHTKQVTRLFESIEGERGFEYVLGVEVGRDITHAELAAAYDAVLYSVGASADRALGIEGEDLPGSASATAFVSWYNGHPDATTCPIPLDHERVVVVGNGNVALDVARILTADPDSLASTDIADHALAALRTSAVREVVVLGRRGPAQAAFTMPELIGLASLDDVDIVVDDGGEPLEATTDKTELLAEIAARPRREGARRIVLRFRTSPLRVLGDERVTAIEVDRTRLEPDADGVLRAVSTGQVETLEAGAVLRSVGYRGRPVRDLPFDEATGTVPHDRGRVEPGVYVAGWIKRGPTGFIGTNKGCSEETVASLLDDLDAGLLTAPTAERPVPAGAIDRAGWRALDAAERTLGQAAGRPRVKLTDLEALRDAARPAVRRRGRVRH